MTAVYIGGIAVGFFGRPRFAAEVEAVFLLSMKDITQFIKLARSEDILPASPMRRISREKTPFLCCDTIPQKQMLTFR
jgi:hypothetical protein